MSIEAAAAAQEALMAEEPVGRFEVGSQSQFILSPKRVTIF